MSFDRSISSETILDADSVEHKDLTGHLCYVENIKEERDLLSYRLRSTYINVSAEDSSESAITFLKRTACQIVVADTLTCGSELLDILDTARNKNPRCSNLILQTDIEPEVLEAATTEYGSQVLLKPYSGDDLIGKLRDCCRDNAMISAEAFQGFDTENAPHDLACEYIAAVQRWCTDLQLFINKRQFQDCRKICMKLKSSASMFGFPELGHVANDVIIALDMTYNIQDSLEELSRLRSFCSGIHISDTPKEE